MRSSVSKESRSVRRPSLLVEGREEMEGGRWKRGEMLPE